MDKVVKREGGERKMGVSLIESQKNYNSPREDCLTNFYEFT